MNNKPLVSVIMPTYNRANIIATAIESVIKQTYENWELLIIDDRSNDNTEDFLKKYTTTDNRIKYIKNTRKKGVCGARNTGLLEAKGDFLAFLDSDDQWYDFHLEQSIEVLIKEKLHVSFSFWDSKLNGEVFNFNDSPEERQHCRETIERLDAVEKDDYIIFGRNFYEDSFTSDFYCYCINTTIIHKEVVDNIGLFNENLVIHEDSDFTVRIFRQYGFCLLKRSSFLYTMGNDDHLFGFVDRVKILDQLKLNNKPADIISNDLLDRLLQSGFPLIKYTNLKLGYINKFKDKELQKITYNDLKKRGAIFCFTFAYLSMHYCKKTSLYFFLYSLRYKFHRKTFAYIFSLILPVIPSKAYQAKNEFDLF